MPAIVLPATVTSVPANMSFRCCQGAERPVECLPSIPEDLVSDEAPDRFTASHRRPFVHGIARAPVHSLAQAPHPHPGLASCGNEIASARRWAAKAKSLRPVAEARGL